VKGTTEGGTQVCELEGLEEGEDPLKLEPTALLEDDEVYDLT